MGVPRSLGDADTIESAGADTFVVVIDKPVAGPQTIGLLPAASLGGGGAAADVSWGGIDGALSDQADLVAALAAKAANEHGHAAATGAAAGFLSAPDKTKLDGIDVAANVNPTAAQIAGLLDAYLGGTAWRTGSAGGVPGLTLVASVYNSAEGAVIADGATGNVNYDTAAYALDSTIALPTATPWEITINDTGEFFILYDVNPTFVQANIKGLATVTLETDAGGSWAPLAGAKVITSEAGISGSAEIQNSYGAGSGYLNLTTSGKKIAVKLAPVVSNSDLKTLAGSCNITIFKLVAGAAPGGGSPITWFDETTELGAQTVVKVTGAGVTATVDGATLVVDIPAQAASAAGNAGTVQFNNAGTQAGAAGINVKSPANGPGYVNHILHANQFTGGFTTETVAANGSWWADSKHDVAYELTLQGAATLKGGVIDVANNGEFASSKIYLKNPTASAVSISVAVGGTDFTQVIGLSNPFTVDAGATKIVYFTARKSAAGVVQKAVEG